MSSLEEGKIADAKSSGPKIANPSPLGLCGFALTTFVLSIHNSGATTLPLPDIVVGLAMFYGGLAQLLAGMWEFRTGNTFGATAFSSFGAFWLSFAAIIVLKLPGAPAEGDPFRGDHAIGIFLLGWTIFTFILFLATFKSNGGLMALFFFLTMTFLLLTLGKFFQLEVGVTSLNGFTRAGGVFGLITAFIAWYVALAGLLTPETSYFTLPIFDLSRKNN